MTAPTPTTSVFASPYVLEWGPMVKYRSINIAHVNLCSGQYHLGWTRIIDMIQSFPTSLNDHESDSFIVNAAMIEAAVKYCQSRLAEEMPPSTAYPMPDGNIMLEWRYQGDVVRRLEILADGSGEYMLSYPDAAGGRKVRFWPLNWTISPAMSYIKVSDMFTGLCENLKYPPASHVLPVKNLKETQFSLAS